jgi:CDGSH-type Zn-finger protein
MFWRRDTKKNQKVKVNKNGPYTISGNLPLSKENIILDEKGDPLSWTPGKTYPNQKSYDLCRCGQSKHKPYCDRTHSYVNFDGTETASRKKYLDQAERTQGPELDLTDAVKLCSSAGFCYRAGGTWELTKDSGRPESKKLAIQQALDCPSGRLVAWDKKNRQPIEPQFKPSVSLAENPAKKLSGPIRIKGRVSVKSADGTLYEIRNRVALCRCGESKNKPFCDGTHLEISFRDDA